MQSNNQKLRAQYNKYSIESLEYKDEAKKRFETVIVNNVDRLPQS